MLKGQKQFSLPEIEERVLRLWRERDIFRRSVDQRKGKKPFRFFEGPPTANGRPGIHHVVSRVFKDIVIRYKAMQGHYAPRRAGWDTHGLPVEIGVEKELGLKNKQEIEKFGIAPFNERAKESVWKYRDEWQRFTDRIGFWLDLEHPYVTYENSYIESLWWVFARIAKRGLLKKFYKVVPFCPRCQTPLSSHELGQPGVYKKTPDPSVFVKFPVKGEKGAYLLVWTTTPWTLPANVAVAVDPALTYTKYKVGKEYYWSHNVPPFLEHQGADIAEKLSGKKLVGLKYKPLYPLKKKTNLKMLHEVIAADFVETAEGSGLVHIAPAFGEDDLRVIQALNRDISAEDIPLTIDDRGRVAAGLPGAGKFIKEADKDILEDLKVRGLLYHAGTIEHDYPFCWRCSTPLIYFARYSWFVLMSGLRDDLLKANKGVNWVPRHIKEGRFGEWLREVKDWAISRDRYWGTPLPIWECGLCAHTLVVSALKDLDTHAERKNSFVLLRHTEAEHNVKELIASGPEKGARISHLTEKGKKDAARVAVRLKKKGIGVIYASPYKRTRETAEIVAKATGAKVVVDERLRELDCGIFNWRAIPDHKKFFASPLEEFVKTPPGGENLTDAKKRIFEFVRDINTKHNKEKILIVGHGDPLWMLEAAMRNATNEEALELSYIATGEVRPVSLHNWPYNAEGRLDIHRPYADGIVLRCPRCAKGEMRRVREVADVWFDSGGMPFAQWHYPFENKTLIEHGTMFPADYICEGLDQTRGWFYTLLAVSVLLKKGAPYRNVISHGLVLDKNGQKMSKSKGNVVDPWEMIQKYGADVMRWFFYTVNPAGEAKRFDEAELGKKLRQFLMMLYNSFVFYDTYGKKNAPAGTATGITHLLDRWILARLQATVETVTNELERYDVGLAAREIEIFVDDLSRWYIRRSRRRFQRPEAKDHEAASWVLGHVLRELSKLMAPFTPFFAEALYQSLSAKGNKDSVHLEDWPKADRTRTDKELLRKMEEARRLSSGGLAARAAQNLKVRQPLRRFTVGSAVLTDTDKEFLRIVAEEVNVKEVKIKNKDASFAELDTVIDAELRREGLLRELARMVQDLRQDAGYAPGERVHVVLDLPDGLRAQVGDLDTLKGEVSAKDVLLGKGQVKLGRMDAEISTKLEEWPLWIGVKK
ncbi:MAG: Isoleucine-tRNA ligase [Parcubacteria group bacterium GW2011_GWA1_60_11]|nr:MAG: Isoleucine-tRNA ligase [Parcubacteria group bacterium GW2011_GWA1_60_11]